MSLVPCPEHQCLEKTAIDIIAGFGNLVRVLNSLSEGIIAHDLQRKIFFFNTQAERITGFVRSEVLGRDRREILGAPFCGQRCSFCADDPITFDQKT